MKKNINIFLYAILIIAIFLGLYRILPYFSNNIPLGYDPGLYRLLFLDYFNNLPNINFSNLTTRTKSAYPPFLGFLGNILQIIGFKIDILLSFGLGFFSLISSLFIYLNLKKYSKITAVIGVIIFLISIIQYQSFWWNYYKQIIGIIFMLSAFFLIEKKKYILSIPIIISLFTIHRPSGVFFLITFFIYKIFNFLQKKDKKYKDILIIFLAGIIALLIYIPLFQEQILSLLKPLFTTVLTEGKSGTFFLKEEFGKYNIFIIFLSLYGLYLKINKKDFDIITSGYLAGMIWVGFGLFFYNRFYIFFDIFIILVSAYGMGQLYKKNIKIFIIIFSLFFISQSIFYYNYVSSHNSPLIPKKEFENIKKINKILPKNSVLMVTHSNYSPWIAGYTYKKTIAPGLFELDKWDKKKWKKWWSSDGKVKCEMIKDYKEYKNLYLWIGKFQQIENLKGGNCFEKTEIAGKNFNLYKINFDKNVK